MDSNEEFVVVNEENDNQRDSIARLDVLVDLFKKTIETLNQSSILLKDELQTALSVTLQNVTPDHTSTIEDLVKQLDSILLSPDDVRKTYVKQLCSRLVAVNEEKQFVMTELVELNDQLRTMEAETRKWKKLIEPISMVAAGIKELESVFSSKSEVDSTDVEPSLSDDSTVDDVCSFLTTMYGKIQNIRDKEPVARKMVSKSTSETCSSVCLVDSVQVSSGRQCTDGVSSNSIQTDCSIAKCDAWMQAEISSPPVVSTNATSQLEPPAYASLSKATVDQTSALENIDVKELVRQEVLRILNERNTISFAPETTTSETEERINSLLAPVAKTPSAQPLSPPTNEIPSSTGSLNLWPHLHLGGVSSVHVAPSFTSEAASAVSIQNQTNVTSSLTSSISESYSTAGISSESKTSMSSFLPVVGGFVRRQIQQLTNPENTTSDYGSWLSELGLNPCESNFNQPVERPSAPSFSVDEEQPWCPGCHQMFASRSELEDHFLSCLI
uniref:Uncharacterized protein n=1 Tax=Trichobilharzia regenti TaxID=157069 RepID=A0AA85JX16_TRIRE|nr:unnamed protein product [Trichobilharzia regenti]